MNLPDPRLRKKTPPVQKFDQDLQKLIDGNLNPTLAYMTGKLKVEGSMGVALKISQLLED